MDDIFEFEDWAEMTGYDRQAYLDSPPVEREVIKDRKIAEISEETWPDEEDEPFC